jgi:uncharacterized protein YgiM (DUF1202 family)
MANNRKQSFAKAEVKEEVLVKEPVEPQEEVKETKKVNKTLRGIVIPAKLNMRAEKSITSNVVGLLIQDTPVNIEKTDSDEWYAVTHAGMSGYVMSKFIKIK